jgi:hypothetical protein
MRIDAEEIGIDLASAIPLPGETADNEAVARHVKHIKGNMVLFDMQRTHFGVNQPPALLVSVPALDNIVINIEVGDKVIGESDARARGNAAMTPTATQAQSIARLQQRRRNQLRGHSWASHGWPGCAIARA